MNDFDKALDFIRNHYFSILVFNKGTKELYERICKRYDAVRVEYDDAVGLRFGLYRYAGYSIYPARCYEISDGRGYYDGQWYSVLSFDRRPTAKVV